MPGGVRGPLRRAAQPERALRLAGAAAALRRTINSPAPPVLREADTRPRPRAADARRGRKRGGIRAGGRSPSQRRPWRRSARAVGSQAGSTEDRRAKKERYGGLTAREREVTAQVAHGKINREIADTLFIAEKTVEWHMSNSLRKLGFRARAELAVWAVTADPAPALPQNDA